MFSLKKFVMIFIIMFAMIFSYGNLSYKAYGAEKVEGDKKKLILLDPGHGGFDGGAEVNGVKEKNINLSIALLLKDELQKNGFEVLMTREKDEALRLDKTKAKTKKSEDMEARCKIKRESNCDMFISIHVNTFPESKYYGGQVWYSGFTESRKLANIIQGNFKKYIDASNNRMEKPSDSYKVLRCCDNVPGVIVECGFISNPNEFQNLISNEYQKNIAETITKSVLEFYAS